jgi:hypothetical protein
MKEEEHLKFKVSSEQRASWGVYCRINPEFGHYSFSSFFLSFFLSSSSPSSTGPRWLVLPEVLQPADLLYEPGFGSSSLYRQEPPRLRRRVISLSGKGGTMGEKWPVNFAVK